MAKARLEARVGLNDRPFRRKLRRLGGLARGFGRGFSRFVLRPMRNLAIAGIAGVTAAAAGIGFLIKKTADYGDAIGKMAKRTGLSVQFLQKLKHAAELGGNSLDDMEKSVGKVTQAAIDAQDGLLTYTRLFDRLGVTFLDNNGTLKESERLFMDVVKALGKVENSTERVGIARKLLGRSGAKMLTMTAGGAEQFLADMREAQALGLVMTDKDVENAERFKDEMLRTKGILAGVARRFGLALIPSLNTALVVFRARFKKLQEEGVFAGFQVKVEHGAALMLAAAETFLKSSNKMGMIGDIIFAAMRAGSDFFALAIRTAFNKTAIGRAATAAKRLAQVQPAFLGGLSVGAPGKGAKEDIRTRIENSAQQAVNAIKGKFEKSAADIAKEFQAELKRLFPDSGKGHDDLMALARTYEDALRKAREEAAGAGDVGPVSSLVAMGAKTAAQASFSADVPRKQLTMLERINQNLMESIRIDRERLRNMNAHLKF